jgi:hypothetical protein
MAADSRNTACRLGDYYSVQNICQAKIAQNQLKLGISHHRLVLFYAEIQFGQKGQYRFMLTHPASFSIHQNLGCLISKKAGTIHFEILIFSEYMPNTFMMY